MKMTNQEIDEAIQADLIREAAPELLEALEWFCERVDKGEVRSVKTYSKFKQLIKKAKGE